MKCPRLVYFQVPADTLGRWERTHVEGAGLPTSPQHLVDGQQLAYTRVFPVPVQIIEVHDDYFIIGNKNTSFFWVFRWNTSSGKWESKVNGTAGQMTDVQMDDPGNRDYYSDKFGQGIRYPRPLINILPFDDYFAVLPYYDNVDFNAAFPKTYFYDFGLETYPAISNEAFVSTGGKQVLDNDLIVSPASGPGLEVRSLFLGASSGFPVIPIVQALTLSDGTTPSVTTTFSPDQFLHDFDGSNGVGYFGSITSETGGAVLGGRTVQEFIFDYSTNLFGTPFRTTLYNNLLQMEGYRIQEWEAISRTLGKREYFIPRQISATNAERGVAATTRFPVSGFDELNGLPSLSISVNSDGEALVTKSEFAYNQYPELASNHQLTGLSGQKTYRIPNFLNASFANEFTSGTFTIIENPSRQQHTISVSSKLEVDGSFGNVDIPVSLAAFTPGNPTLNQGDEIVFSVRVNTNQPFVYDNLSIGLKINDVTVTIPFNSPNITAIGIPHTYVRGYIIPHTISTPTYLAWNISGIDNDIELDFVHVSISKNPTPQDKIIASYATVWKDFETAGWRQEETFKWNVPMNGSGQATVPFTAFNHVSPQNNGSVWESNGKKTFFNIHGRLSETSRADGYKSSIVSTHKPGLVVGSVVGAAFDESGVLTGDYDLNEFITYGSTSVPAFDKANGWEKAGGVLSSDEYKFGMNSIFVENAFGPTRNFKINPGKDYIFSAWVKVVSGQLVLGGDYRKLKIGASNAFPFNLGPHETNFGTPPIVVNGVAGADWQYVELTIPASTDITGNDWYTRVFVGTPNSGSAYVTDIRFYPEEAMVTTTYYDPVFRNVVATVDPNNKATYRSLDSFGRLSQIWNNARQLIKSVTYDLAGD